MRKARLHNGVELVFPDNTPDEVIDRAVQEFVSAGPAAEPVDPGAQAIGVLTETIAAISAQQGETAAQETAVQVEMLGVANEIRDALTSLGEGLRMSAEIERARAQALEQGLNALAAEVIRTLGSVAALIAREKKIVLDANNNPVGIKYVGR